MKQRGHDFRKDWGDTKNPLRGEGGRQV